MQNRINWIDWAKVFTMIFVILGHAQYKDSEVEIRNFIYSFHMPLFIFLSGYLFKKESTLAESIKKDIKGLILPYILLSLISFSIFYLPDYLLGKAHFLHFHNTIYHFFVGGVSSPSGALWFLLCLFFIKAYAYITLNQKKYIQILICIVLPILCNFLIKGLHIDLIWGIDSAMIGLPFFILGFYCKKNKNLLKIPNKRTLLSVFIISTIILILINKIQGRVDISGCGMGKYPILYFVASIIGCMMVFSFSQLFNDLSNKLLKTLSTGTLLILAFHPQIFNYIIRFDFKIFSFFEINILTNTVNSIITLIIFYYPIILVMKYCPILIGNRMINTFNI